jgi:hypothetical protein
MKIQSGHRIEFVELADRVELTDHIDADHGGGEGTVTDICDGALSVLLDGGRTVTTYSVLKSRGRSGIDCGSAKLRD